MDHLISHIHMHLLYLFFNARNCATNGSNFTFFLHTRFRTVEKIEPSSMMHFFLSHLPCISLGRVKKWIKGVDANIQRNLISRLSIKSAGTQSSFSFVFPQEMTSEYEGHLPVCHCKCGYPQNQPPATERCFVTCYQIYKVSYSFELC